MPVEDWIERWTDAQTRELERIEKNHGDRMDRIEASIEKLDKKLDGIAEELKQIRDGNRDHSVDLAVIKTKLAIYAAASGLIAGAIISWFVTFVFPSKP